MIFNLTQPVLDSAPKFTYTGTYEYIDDGAGNWRIKFLSSGVFTPLKDMTIDAFLVGGGGAGGYRSGTVSSSAHASGGGSGYTKTAKSVTLHKGTQYNIVIGNGGTMGTAGGNTEAFGETANGGMPGNFSTTASLTTGGDGGSGGGGASRSSSTLPGAGGSDGADGAASGSTSGGKGQGTTTREFGESTGDLYAAGGGGKNEAGTSPGGDGGGGEGGVDAEANTGSGGGALKSGGSGIVVIRKHKEAAA